MKRTNDYVKCTTWALLLGLLSGAVAFASKIEKDAPLVTYVDRAPFYTGFETNLVNVFRVGTLLTAVQETHNPYDPNLIALYDGANKVGYIPRENQPQVYALLANKPGATISVVDVDPLHPWRGVKIRVGADG